MYSREERMKAIELYIKYDKCAADVVREMGRIIASTQKMYYTDERLDRKCAN